MSDVISLPEVSRELVSWILRQRDVSVADAAAFIGKDREETRAMLSELGAQGFIEEEVTAADETRFRARLAARSNRRIPQAIWDALGQATQ